MGQAVARRAHRSRCQVESCAHRGPCGGRDGPGVTPPAGGATGGAARPFGGPGTSRTTGACRGVRRPTPVLSPARPCGEPARALVADSRRRTRVPGRRAATTLGGPGGGPAGGAEGWRRVPAAGSTSTSAPAGTGTPWRTARGDVGRGGAAGGGSRPDARDPPGGRGAHRHPGLRDPHLRVDGPTEGRPGHAGRPGHLPHRDGRCRPVVAGGPGAGGHHGRVRHLRPGTVPPPGQRRAGGDGPRRRGWRPRRCRAADRPGRCHGRAGDSHPVVRAAHRRYGGPDRGACPGWRGGVTRRAGG